MEQTLGKRIVSNRKALGLTQDQLAEKLGVTAQAVSKWENDQSCPDINMLPKLAEIFGITTDALLGCEPAGPVHQAEVVSDYAENENNGFHFQSDKGNFEFKWDGGRRGAVATAVGALTVGLLLLAAKILKWDVTFWEILWPTALLVYGVKAMIDKFSVFSCGCTLFGGYFLLENLGLLHFKLGGELVFPIIILIFGISLLADALKKPNRRSRFSVSHNGIPVSQGEHEVKNECTTDGEHFTCTLAFGEGSQYIQLPRLSGGEISSAFGELTVDLTGCQEIAPQCDLSANCSFGELKLLVPRSCRVEPSTSTAFASLEIKGSPDAAPASVIRLDASISFGQIEVRYI